MVSDAVSAGRQAQKQPVEAQRPKSMAKRTPKIVTVRQQISWAYANLARAHVAVEEGRDRYHRHHHIIRSRLYSGLTKGTMSMRSIFDDERLKMILPQICAYCGLGNQLSLDHLIPRRAGGIDDPANLVWACRRCNSAKGGRDMLRWLLGDGRFPSIFVLRRYLKCMYAFCEARGLMESHWNCVQPEELPFAIELFR